ncbi:hypothetical protein LX36DRAFT_283320 [Colletotrichum falcatum]|nr:hypothetical protein LX36DRAFT_283320 [Colletotrichum falcatum]
MWHVGRDTHTHTQRRRRRNTWDSVPCAWYGRGRGAMRFSRLRQPARGKPPRWPPPPASSHSVSASVQGTGMIPRMRLEPSAHWDPWKNRIEAGAPRLRDHALLFLQPAYSRASHLYLSEPGGKAPAGWNDQQDGAVADALDPLGPPLSRGACCRLTTSHGLV